MKTHIALALTLIGLALTPGTFGAEKEKGHDHEHEHAEKVAGPNGGRVIHITEPHFEFLVTEDRKVQITFLGEDGKAIAPAEQSVSAIGGERSKPTKMAFEKTETGLVSDQALPEGETIPIVLTVKSAPGEKSVTEKFTINLANCPECKLKEYACICEHDH